MTHSYFEIRERCPSCHSTQFREIYRAAYDQPSVRDYLKSFYDPQGGVEFQYLQNAHYDLNECRDCKLIFQREIPNDDLMERLYEHWIDPAKAYQEHLETYDLNLSSIYAQEISAVVAYLQKRPCDLKFFDFGMGWGAWAALAKAYGCESCGAELSQSRIEHARTFGITLINWEEIPQQQFDFINTEQVFEHIPQPLETLIHLKRALKDDGLIKISVPTALNIAHRLELMDWQASKWSRHSLNPVAPLEHINFYRRESLLQMAKLADLQEVRIPLRYFYRFATNWRGITKIAQNLIAPISRMLLKRENYLFFKKKKS